MIGTTRYNQGGLCVCVRACVRACMRVCVRACVRVCVYRGISSEMVIDKSGYVSVDPAGTVLEV